MPWRRNAESVYREIDAHGPAASHRPGDNLFVAAHKHERQRNEWPSLIFEPA
ncbi:MAG: hypothetical protein JNL12_07540 [Planctomycetes bacterium]|nr:hypothetical protein [Planctomycetota bacterium]